MNMKGMKFAGAVFDDPILDRSLLGDDVGHAGFGIERRRRLAVYGDIKFRRAVGIVGVEKLFGEIQSSRPHWSNASQPGQLWRRKG